MKTNVSIRRMTKRLRHRGKYLKAERSPQPDRRCIGFDYRIELHSPVTVCACLFQNIAAESQAYALAAARRVDNESGIGDVRPRAGVVRMSVRAADDASIVIDSHDGAPR
jgi:hypothetical protein